MALSAPAMAPAKVSALTLKLPPSADGADRRQHRDQLAAEHRVEHRQVDLVRLADEAEIDDLLDIGIRIDHAARRLLGDHHVAVLAAQADGLAAGGVDVADDLLVDRAGQHHLDDFQRVAASVTRRPPANCDCTPAFLSIASICGPPPCTTTGLIAVCSSSTMSRAKERASALVAHGVAAVFDDDGFLVVALHVRQRLGQDAGLLLRVCLGLVTHRRCSGAFWRSRSSRQWRRPRGSSSPAFRRSHTPRSALSRAIAARNSGMPSPVRDEVGSTCGKAAGRFLSAASTASMRSASSEALHLVGLGQHDLMADRGLAQGIERRGVGVLEAMPRVDQHIDPREIGAADQVVLHQLGPGLARCPWARRHSRSPACRPGSGWGRRRRKSAPGCGRGCARCGPARCARSAR